MEILLKLIKNEFDNKKGWRSSASLLVKS